jgi:hypothetical protein
MATNIDPDSDFDGDGKTNLQEYLAQTDPTKVPHKYEVGFVWDAAHLTGKGSINPDPDKLGHKNVWHYLYTIDKTEYAEKFGKGYKPFERSYGKRKYFVSTGIPVDGNPCLRTTKDDSILEFKCSSIIKPVTLAWQSPVDGTVSLKATVVVEGENGRFSNAKGKLSVLDGKDLLIESSYEPGEGGGIQLDNIAVKKGDFVYISVQGQLFIGNIKIQLEQKKIKMEQENEI